MGLSRWRSGRLAHYFVSRCSCIELGITRAAPLSIHLDEDRLRVILCIHSLRRGGAERVVLELASGLAKRGHEVVVVPWVDVDEHVEERYRRIPREYLTPATEYRWPISAFQAGRRFRER